MYLSVKLDIDEWQCIVYMPERAIKTFVILDVNLIAIKMMLNKISIKAKTQYELLVPSADILITKTLHDNISHPRLLFLIRDCRTQCGEVVCFDTIKWDEDLQ